MKGCFHWREHAPTQHGYTSRKTSASSSLVHIGMASSVPRRPLILNSSETCTLTVCYEACTIPISAFPQLRTLVGDT